MKTIVAANPHLATKPIHRAHVFFQTRRLGNGGPVSGTGVTLVLFEDAGRAAREHRVTTEIVGPLTAPKVAAALQQLAEGVV